MKRGRRNGGKEFGGIRMLSGNRQASSRSPQMSDHMVAVISREVLW